MLGHKIGLREVEHCSTDAIYVCFTTPRGLGWSVDTLAGSGRSCISPDGKFVVASNMYDGVDFYSIPTHAFSHTVLYRVNPHMNSPIPVEFIPDGRTLLIGGTYGSARMIDTQTSETIQLLPHSGEYAFQAVAACAELPEAI